MMVLFFCGILERLNLCTHTHTRMFNGLFSRTTWVSRHQKGRTILDFIKARDDGMAVLSAARMQIICTLPQKDNHASNYHLVLQAGCLSCHPTNNVKALKAQALKVTDTIYKQVISVTKSHTRHLIANS